MISLKALNRPRVFLFSILAILSLYVLVVQKPLFLIGARTSIWPGTNRCPGYWFRMACWEYNGMACIVKTPNNNS